MGRKNIVSQRLLDILDSKLLRFTDIHDEYKRRYKKVAYKQISDNLKRLELRGIVSCIAAHYYLTSDSEAPIEEKIRYAREAVGILLHGMEKNIKNMDRIGYILAVARITATPLHLIWDKDKIMKLILKQQEQLEGLVEILEEETA